MFLFCQRRSSINVRGLASAGTRNHDGVDDPWRNDMHLARVYLFYGDRSVAVFESKEGAFDSEPLHTVWPAVILTSTTLLAHITVWVIGPATYMIL